MAWHLAGPLLCANGSLDGRRSRPGPGCLQFLKSLAVDRNMSSTTPPSSRRRPSTREAASSRPPHGHIATAHTQRPPPTNNRALRTEAARAGAVGLWGLGEGVSTVRCCLPRAFVLLFSVYYVFLFRFSFSAMRFSLSGRI
jgi:hypothetical protein